MRKQELARVKLEASKYFNKIDFIGNEFAIFNDISDGGNIVNNFHRLASPQVALLFA